jgi:asparagine synthase (glutamine-hydrolysing)
MCGINGIFAYSHASNLIDRGELLRTRDYMASRGPDGSGQWVADDERIGFGHRRLSIVDLSEAGSQPMFSDDRCLVVTFNGEIYNYPELRRNLEAKGCIFRTRCDTEVLLHLYAMKGAELVHDLRGMFAFAIWDRSKGGLLLARDPYGIKPLYTANDGWTIRFASQVKALLAGDRVSRDPDPAGIVGFYLWGSVPEPFTLYREIRSLPAGCTQWIDAAGPRVPHPYASIPATLALIEGTPKGQDEIAATVQRGLLDSVAAHLMADVDVGVFLSSGVDSAGLLALMRDAGQEKIQAITLAFDEFGNTPEDESPLAAKIALCYGAQHIVRRVSRNEFTKDLPAILEAMDQPSIDGVNTWFVSKATREVGLKVALSGLGGDELLAGYPSFREIPKWVRYLRIPSAIPGLGVAARSVGTAFGIAGRIPKGLGMLEFGGSYAGAYLLRRALYLPFELKTQLDPDLLRDGMRRLRTLKRISDAALEPMPNSAVGRVAALESTCYMRNQLLRDSDWAGMAHSIEIRTPLVDYQLLRTIAPVLPHLHSGLGKKLIANAPSRPLPDFIVNRPKTGFGVPTGRWMEISFTQRDVATKGRASRAWAGYVGQCLLSNMPKAVSSWHGNLDSAKPQMAHL